MISFPFLAVFEACAFFIFFLLSFFFLSIINVRDACDARTRAPCLDFDARIEGTCDRWWYAERSYI